MEAYDISVQLLLREFHTNITIIPKKERDQSTKSMKEAKLKLTLNETLMNRVKEINRIDSDLYDLSKLLSYNLSDCFFHFLLTAVERFCETIQKHPDLSENLRKTTKVNCES